MRFLGRRPKSWLHRFLAVLIMLSFGGMLLGIDQLATASSVKAFTLPLVMINEVAWAGTKSNSSHQWIELYNPGTVDIDLTGWKLKVSAIEINLSSGNPAAPNIISKGGYFLLERDETATTVKADLLYTVDLDTAGMLLQLVNVDVVIDTANGNGGWQAGSASDFCSMERVPFQSDADSAVWLTNDNVIKNDKDNSGNDLCGTPKSKNSTHLPYAEGALIINEIAWMGTLADPGSEWIELYNPGEDPINLAGWILRSELGPFEIPLVGKILPKKYFLLGRRLDPADPGPFTVSADITVDQLYYIGSTLDNHGEYLQLIAPTSKLIDTANSQKVTWPAGNDTTFCSMERAGFSLPDSPGSWVTNIGLVTVGFDRKGNKICGTPGHENWAYTVTPTPTPSRTPTITGTPTRTPTRTRTPILSRTPAPTTTPTRTPKHSPTPTLDPNRVLPSSVVLNEFLPQPRSDWNGDGSVNSGDEFIEILNLSTVAISLSGWSLDDQEGDSLPFTIGDITIQPKTRLAFFSSETGILLSNGGDSVRLFKSGGQISDAFTYSVIAIPNQSWCRLPDGGSTWVFGCVPTSTESNKLAQNIFVGNQVQSVICLSKTLTLGVWLAECDAAGLFAWNSNLWQASPMYPLYLEAGLDVYILD